MALNRFIGWSRTELESARRAVQTARLTGQPTELSIAGVRTVFDPVKLDLDRVLNDVQLSLSELPDSTDPSPFGNEVMAVQTRFS